MLNFDFKNTSEATSFDRFKLPERQSDSYKLPDQDPTTSLLPSYADIIASASAPLHQIPSQTPGFSQYSQYSQYAKPAYQSQPYSGAGVGYERNFQAKSDLLPFDSIIQPQQPTIPAFGRFEEPPATLRSDNTMHSPGLTTIAGGSPPQYIPDQRDYL